MSKIYDNTSAQRALDPDVRTDAATGEKVVDTQGYNDGMLVVTLGDITETTGDTFAFKVMECDTSTGTFTDSGIAVNITGDGAQDNQVAVARIPQLNVVRKRFLRVDLACTATTTSVEGGAVILLGGANSGPVNDD